jgi:hypothetical protein
VFELARHSGGQCDYEHVSTNCGTVLVTLIEKFVVMYLRSDSTY